MKKYLVLGLLLFMPFIAAANTQVFGFNNGAFYDIKGNALAICFLDATCLKADGSTTTLSSLLGLSAATPQTITVTDGVPDSTPVSAPIVSAPAPVVAPAPTNSDITPPNLLALSYWSCSWGQNCNVSANLYSGGPGREALSRFSQSDGSNNYISVATDEDTTAQFTFTPAVYVPATTTLDGVRISSKWQATGEDLTYSDNNLVNVHNVNYADVPLASGITYIGSIVLTDASGNQTVISGYGPGYNIHISVK